MDDNELADVLSMIPELKKQVADLKKVLFAIEHLAQAPHWDSKRRWKIAEMAANARKSEV